MAGVYRRCGALHRIPRSSSRGRPGLAQGGAAGAKVAAHPSVRCTTVRALAGGQAPRKVEIPANAAKALLEEGNPVPVEISDHEALFTTSQGWRVLIVAHTDMTLSYHLEEKVR